MSCEECDKEQERVLSGDDSRLAYFRVDNANVLVIACDKHLLQVQRILRKEE